MFMSDTRTVKFTIERIPNSYYQEITTISGFFTKKTSVWTDLYIKGNRYCSSGWLHSSHEDYIRLLNKSFLYSFNSYSNCYNKYEWLFRILKGLAVNYCTYYAYSRYYSFKFVEKAFTKTKYEDKFVDHVALDYKFKKNERTGELYKDSGLIYVYFANNQGSKEYSISSIDLDIIVDIIAMGALAQLDSNPNCIFYYLPEGNTLDYALGKRWITK